MPDKCSVQFSQFSMTNRKTKHVLAFCHGFAKGRSYLDLDLVAKKAFSEGFTCPYCGEFIKPWVRIRVPVVKLRVSK